MHFCLFDLLCLYIELSSGGEGLHQVCADKWRFCWTFKHCIFLLLLVVRCTHQYSLCVPFLTVPTYAMFSKISEHAHHTLLMVTVEHEQELHSPNRLN